MRSGEQKGPKHLYICTSMQSGQSCGNQWPHNYCLWLGNLTTWQYRQRMRVSHAFSLSRAPGHVWLWHHWDLNSRSRQTFFCSWSRHPFYGYSSPFHKVLKVYSIPDIAIYLITTPLCAWWTSYSKTTNVTMDFSPYSASKLLTGWCSNYITQSWQEGPRGMFTTPRGIHTVYIPLHTAQRGLTGKYLCR